MKALLPNLITSVRFLLALVFCVLLENYQHTKDGPRVLLDVAFSIFVFTAVTDILDGYLARRWNQESTFGRILDPLVDKVLVIGAFLYLASDHFAVVENGRMVNASHVAVWMVVLILIRELLVTGLRGFSEAQGLAFRATIPGKLKMFVQCWAAGATMMITSHLSDLGDSAQVFWSRVRTLSLWAMVLVTFFSMLVYVARARVLFTMAMKGRGGEASPPSAPKKD